MKSALCLFAMLMVTLLSTFAHAEDAAQWITFDGGDGPGKGKHIVLISGDEEYRSEEGLPQLAKILSTHHGFKCTVLFALDPKTGTIDPNNQHNIPGFEALDSADLLIILTRFRNPSDEAMKHLDDYLKAGKPVIGLRTATHAFAGLKGPYEVYNWTYKGAVKEWSQGFGRAILGETWISHHGGHKHESTLGIFAPDAKGNPLLNGINDKEIWGSTDVYGVRLPLPGDSKPLVLGQVTKSSGTGPEEFFKMSPTDKEAVEGAKNNPMMPVAWTKSYQIPDGKTGHSFTTTMGSSTDLTNAPLRRLIVNAAYSLTGLEVPKEAKVDLVGEYKPRAYSAGGYTKGVKPADLK